MTNADLHYKKMTETPVPKLILQLGIPTTISMLITSIYNMADTYFVGTLGESAQAATGVLFTLQAIIQGIAFMLGQGSGTFVSKSLANKNTDEATMYVSTSFFYRWLDWCSHHVFWSFLSETYGAVPWQHTDHSSPCDGLWFLDTAGLSVYHLLHDTE